MQETTFEWGSATFTVKPASIRMAIQRDQIIANLLDVLPDGGSIESYYYAKFCTQVSVDGELSWSIPPATLTGEELGESFDQFSSLPESLLRQFIRALNSVDGPYVSAEFSATVDAATLDPKD